MRDTVLCSLMTQTDIITLLLAEVVVDDLGSGSSRVYDLFDAGTVATSLWVLSFDLALSCKNAPQQRSVGWFPSKEFLQSDAFSTVWIRSLTDFALKKLQFQIP
ncbi:hypothetical protein KM043_015663 [Ampulex compressa]|nr:hypothetical protein KM043_015663 [Ampulex compressa]